MNIRHSREGTRTVGINKFADCISTALRRSTLRDILALLAFFRNRTRKRRPIVVPTREKLPGFAVSVPSPSVTGSPRSDKLQELSLSYAKRFVIVKFRWFRLPL